MTKLDMMAFKQFIPEKPGSQLRVTVRPEKCFTLNAGSVRKMNLKSGDFVALYFNDDRRVVGIQPIEKYQPGAAKVYVSSGARIAVREFINWIGVDYKQTHRFEAKWHEKEGILVFDLTKALK